MSFEYKGSGRGFVQIRCKSYLPGKDVRLLQESSAIGDYEDAVENPGSSFLWVGEDFHMNREEVREMVGALAVWLETGRLPTGPCSEVLTDGD